MHQNNCHNCIHFYITYRPKFPNGCKAFGIISAKVPYLKIKKISGTNCAMFSKKKKNVKTIKIGRIA